MARKQERSETDGLVTTVKDLQELAGALGLSRQGSKATLQQRIDDHNAETSEAKSARKTAVKKVAVKKPAVKPAKGICEWTVAEGSKQVPGEHGTLKRYGQALRAGVTPCQACKTANTQKDLAYRRARKAEEQVAKE